MPVRTGILYNGRDLENGNGFSITRSETILKSFALRLTPVFVPFFNNGSPLNGPFMGSFF